MTSDPQIPLEEFVELAQFKLDRDTIRSLSFDFCSKRGVVVLGELGADGVPATVGMLVPQDLDTVDSLEAALGRPVRPVRLHRHEIDRALAAGYPPIETPTKRGTIRLRPVRRVSYRPGREADRLVREAIAQAITLGASDVHFECYRDDLDVRVRLDGVLRQVSTPIAQDQASATISYLKVLAGLDIAERRRSQDGRILALFDDEKGETREIDLRLSVLPGPHGEDAVVRVLDSSRADLGLEALGFDTDTARSLRDLVASPEGMFLITGPTGSGKTTTLYSALGDINHEGNKLLTVENPIEYELPKANQKQVSPVMGFADYARAFLRQDPDVLMIGEIRDEETAGLAIRAAQTGHLVLSTLHTRDSVGAVPRLTTLGADPALISDALLGVLAQRLVRRICPECREEAEPDPRLLARLGLPAPDFPIFHGRGCEACLDDGYRGRVGIFELFLIDGEASDQIAAGTPPHGIRREARLRGMRTLLDDALGKLESGTTSLAEIARHIPYGVARDRSSG